MKKATLLCLLLVVLALSCQYPPFLKYYLPSKKTHVPRFTKWDNVIGSNSNPLRSYDVKFYDWTVHVNPQNKTIQSVMKIQFKMECLQDSILLDLERHLKIDSVKSSIPLKKTKRKKDALFIIFNREVQKGESVLLEIAYHGTPTKILSYTAINWGADKNNVPWISTATEGIGPHHMMPCKNLLADEPDSCFIRVGVPYGLVGVANGKLDSVTKTPSEKIYHWAVRNPINIYNLSFNVGDYVKLEKNYTDINQVNQKIEIYALAYNKVIADTFYNQAPIIMQKLENLYGPYPWWKDGCKIIETNLPHGVCMEHQSAISMTNAYQTHYKNINFTLVHELTHEWWGNSVTAYDYADLWLHEGFAEYTEALFAERHLGKEHYGIFIRRFSKSIANKRPVVKPYNVRYNNLVHDHDQDIYNKGVLFLHTLRMQLNNDTLFFKALKNAQQHFAKSNITTEQFMLFFNEETKRDFTPFFDVYLKQIKPPILEFRIDKSRSDSTIIEYRWSETLPTRFDMNVILMVGETSQTIRPSTIKQQIKLPINQPFGFDITKFGYVLFVKKED
ncbi:MAG: M1 family metallopeptidase [Bacteroidia bacterium]